MKHKIVAKSHEFVAKNSQTSLIIGVVLLLIIVGGAFAYYRVSATLSDTKARFASSTAEYETTVKNLEIEIARVNEDNRRLVSYLDKERGHVTSLTDTLAEVSSTVDTLEKLTRIDPELLQKYSRVFFLNENYTPEKLTTIPPQYAFDPTRQQKIHAEVWPQLQRLIEAAEVNGTPLRVVSAFRSFGEQSALKDSYKVTYGSGANKFSADQGYSEHQLGTTLDFTTPGSVPLSTQFDTTETFEWLKNNAYRFGFILSYPKGNTFYEYEPWHWRFVGVALATKLHLEGKNFYDLDQREIDTYLVHFFDQN